MVTKKYRCFMYVAKHISFFRYKITPDDEINFGPLAVGTRKSATITIENNGLFDFRYTISKIMRATDVSKKIVNKCE